MGYVASDPRTCPIAGDSEKVARSPSSKVTMMTFPARQASWNLPHLVNQGCCRFLRLFLPSLNVTRSSITNASVEPAPNARAVKPRIEGEEKMAPGICVV